KTVHEITEQRLVITVDKAQRVYLGNDAINIHELGSKVQSQLKKPQDAVYLRCDETVPFGLFASVIDTLRQSGINNISIVTQPLTERSRAQQSMYTVVANSELSFRPYLTVSGILHSALILVLALSAYFHWSCTRWA